MFFNILCRPVAIATVSGNSGFMGTLHEEEVKSIASFECGGLAI